MYACMYIHPYLYVSVYMYMRSCMASHSTELAAMSAAMVLLAVAAGPAASGAQAWGCGGQQGISWTA